MKKSFLAGLRYYNGCNHQLAMIDSSDLAQNRRGYFFLRHPKISPKTIIEQDRPLCIKTQPIAHALANGIYLFADDLCKPDFDTPDSPLQYDAIIVSSLYASQAFRRLTPYNQDYIDRLFTPIAVFETNPDKNHRPRKVGVAGFKKVVSFRRPNDYVNLIHCHNPVSRVAILDSLSWFTNTNYYVDQATLDAIAFLQNYLDGPISPVTPTYSVGAFPG